MKIFVVYAKLNLTKKPKWLDAFRLKYDKPYEDHITLKQPCFVEEDEVSSLKNKLSDYFNSKSINKISLEFDSKKVAKHESTYIMINTSSEEIYKLQKDIVFILSGYNKYVKPKYQEFEDNFMPHITVARSSDDATAKNALEEFGEDFKCTALIEKIVLAVVDNATPIESNNPKNQTIFELK